MAWEGTGKVKMSLLTIIHLHHHITGKKEGGRGWEENNKRTNQQGGVYGKLSPPQMGRE